MPSNGSSSRYWSPCYWSASRMCWLAKAAERVAPGLRALWRSQLNAVKLSSHEDPVPGTAHVSLFEALSKGPPPAGNLAVPIFAHGSLNVELYTPKGHDPQKPHSRDEIYFVARG